MQSTEHFARKIIVQLVEYSTDTSALHVILGEIQSDTVCDKAAPLKIQVTIESGSKSERKFWRNITAGFATMQ